MSMGSPTRPLSGQSYFSARNARTVYEADGMPRMNVVHRELWRSDPTRRRALALIHAEAKKRRRGGRR